MCKSSMKAISYASYCCGTTDRKCNLLVKSCMHQILNANKKNCMQIPTGGTVSVNVILNLNPDLSYTTFEDGSHIHTTSTTL